MNWLKKTPEPKVGEIWILKKQVTNPFETMVRSSICEVKQGLVRYRFISTTTLHSKKMEEFMSMYKKDEQ